MLIEMMKGVVDMNGAKVGEKHTGVHGIGIDQRCRKKVEAVKECARRKNRAEHGHRQPCKEPDFPLDVACPAGTAFTDSFRDAIHAFVEGELLRERELRQ